MITYQAVLWVFQSLIIILKIILATRTIFIFMVFLSSMNLTSTVRSMITKTIHLRQLSFVMKPSASKDKGSLFLMKLQQKMPAIISLQ